MTASIIWSPTALEIDNQGTIEPQLDKHDGVYYNLTPLRKNSDTTLVAFLREDLGKVVKIVKRKPL